MKGWLKRLRNGPVIEETVHPIFGPMELTNVRGEECWEADRVPFNENFISVIVNTSRSLPPSEDQIRFFRAVTEDLDAAFAKAARVLVPEYEQTYGRFTGNWRETFQFVGIEVPLDADQRNRWYLQFQARTHRMDLFTIHFRDGEASSVDHDT